jgi:hypothetical protein
VTGVLFRRCERAYDDAQRQTVECDTVLLAAGQAPNLGFLPPVGEDVDEMRPG